MPADTPLIKNLDNPVYMKAILNGKKSLQDKFAEIDYKKVIAKMKDVKNMESKIPAKIKKLIRKNESMCRLLYLIAS